MADDAATTTHAVLALLLLFNALVFAALLRRARRDGARAGTARAEHEAELDERPAALPLVRALSLGRRRRRLPLHRARAEP
ncbi:hypothetical protein ABZ069_31840 [Streptomyces microflavus]|uniref:hypothetical protein n=1 Tax=Streptomyces microflavus TaxID=1919 RepID=UPI0033B00CDF